MGQIGEQEQKGRSGHGWKGKKEASKNRKRQFIISLCNRTVFSPKASSSCSAVLPSGQSRYYAAMWNSGSTPADNGTARCLAAYDQVAQYNISLATGVINATFVSSFTGATLQVALACNTLSRSSVSFVGPIGPPTALTLLGSISLLCLNTPPPSIPPPNGGGDGPGTSDGGSDWVLILVVVLIVVIVMLVALLVVTCCYARHGGNAPLARSLRSKLRIRQPDETPED